MNSLNFAALAKEILLDKEQCTRISKVSNYNLTFSK